MLPFERIAEVVNMFNTIFAGKNISYNHSQRLIMENLKISCMKINSTQLEILLITDSSYLHMEWMEKEDRGKSNFLSDKDRLEEACWEGLLPEMLPEIFGKTGREKNVYLWQTRQAKSFIDIEIGQKPISIDPGSSLNPYSFLRYKSPN